MLIADACWEGTVRAKICCFPKQTVAKDIAILDFFVFIFSYAICDRSRRNFTDIPLNMFLP